MNIKTALLAVATAGMALVHTVSASWQPTGRTDILRMPNMQGTNGSAIRLTAQVFFEEKDVVGRRAVYRWSPLVGANIQFTMRPSTGVQVLNTVTDPAGYAGVNWLIPSRNRDRSIQYGAKFLGGFSQGYYFRPSSAAATIYVNR